MSGPIAALKLHVPDFNRELKIAPQALMFVFFDSKTGKAVELVG